MQKAADLVRISGAKLIGFPERSSRTPARQSGRVVIRSDEKRSGRIRERQIIDKSALDAPGNDREATDKWPRAAGVGV
jgi:hypothetical protein